MGEELLRARALAWWLIGLGIVPGLAGADDGAARGGVIRAVEVRLDAPLGRPLDVAGELAFRPGDRLTEEAVRRTLHNLHATGLVSRASVHARPAAGGVDAIVSLHGHTWVRSVRLTGAIGLPRRDAEAALVQRPGHPLVESRVIRGLYNLQDLYDRRGYRQASVNLEVVRYSELKRVDVLYQIASGPRATIGRIGFTGELGRYSPDELRSVLKAIESTDYDPDGIAADTRRLRRWLVERGHLKAEVRRPTETYDPATHRTALEYGVSVGPTVDVEVVGADRDLLLKRGLLPFLEDRVYDQALVAQSCQRIAADYQARGHYRVSVDCPQDEHDGDATLIVRIDPGPQQRLTEIHFRGNEHASAHELKALMGTSTPKALRKGSGRLVDQVLASDLANIRSFYLLRGFADVRVGPPEVAVEGRRLSLAIPIEEGRQQRVVAIRFSGLRGFEASDLLEKLPLRPAGPYHRVLVAEAARWIEALYEDEGYRSTTAEPHEDWDSDRALVDLRFDITEGPRTTVDRLVLNGHSHTRSELLRRFIRLRPGDPVSRRRLLEVERDLYRLGIFSSVDVELATIADIDGRRDVIVSLEEGSRWRVGYGVSYHSDAGPGGLLALSRLNVDGRAGRLQVDLRANERDQRFRLLFDQPTFWGRKVPITYTLFRQEEERESFTVDDLGAQVALTKDFPSLRLGLVYELRQVRLSGEVADLTQLDRNRRRIEISSLIPNVFIDRRDDPIDPSRGWSSALQLEYAFPFLETDTSFAKLFLQHTRYGPLGDFGLLAGSLRLGAIEPLDRGVEPDPLVPPGLEARFVPPSERFFAGGRTTHRAYERDRLGIPGVSLLDIDGRIVEIGGNGLFLANLDYRFPIAGQFGGTLFVDVGNVWSDWRDFDPADLKPGIGAGFRYRSPIGPVRLEVGWKLDAGAGDKNPILFLSFGNPF